MVPLLIEKNKPFPEKIKLQGTNITPKVFVSCSGVFWGKAYTVL